MNRDVITLLMLAALCFCSALLVLYAKFLSTQAYIRVSQYQVLIDDLDVQWSQLQIEESTLSEHGRVERLAKDELGMTYPALDATVMIVR